MADIGNLFGALYDIDLSYFVRIDNHINNMKEGGFHRGEPIFYKELTDDVEKFRRHIQIYRQLQPFREGCAEILNITSEYFIIDDLPF